ncbi:hypothetical protein BD626DRAFT_393668 [Schizophyllum amplum]|uniref:Glycosyltransferase 61 catalytic domain-containing protein n=1 Tax=Schizophyllum amplum TaxID=97359 RepID=A0A550CU71_9AGAR|nr:hypothetical protein BD626DRAFT_393668 [Auriculariopsis ampla]
MPTRREVLIVCLLLVGLFVVSRPSSDGFRIQNPFSGDDGGEALNSQIPDMLDKINQHGGSVDGRIWDTQLTWQGGKVPETTVAVHGSGWTLFDKLYIKGGVMYVVSDDKSKVPPVKDIVSKGIFMKNGPGEEDKRLPTDKDIQIISTREAKKLFGDSASIIDGVSWLINDPPQFITHYYHWSAELWFGLWRAYSSLDTIIAKDGKTSLKAPRRLMFTHLDAHHWRDYADMNQFVVRSTVPSITMEFIDDWRDRAEMDRAFVFDRILIEDRSAAFLSKEVQRYQRIVANTFQLPGSVNWWMTVRNNVIEFAGVHRSIGEGVTGKPVITYISRQTWGRRMLKPEDHDRLVAELNKLHDTYGYEVNIVSMDKLSRMEQIQLAARTTIMMGVHGNGLTSLIWMNSSPRATVMEFFFPGGFAHDYEYTSRAMGLTHYGFHNDK